MMGFFTVAPNERAVLTSFGRAQRISGATTLDTPLADAFRRRVIESARVQRWLRYGFAAAFAGLGAKLALSDK